MRERERNMYCVLQREKERKRERTRGEQKRGGEQKVTVACRRVLDVASGRPRVARGPWPRFVPTTVEWSAARGPRRERKREERRLELEGLTRVKREKREREREQPKGGRAERFSLRIAR